MISPIRYIVTVNKRSKLTIFTIAIVIMFITSTLVIVYSFEMSNETLVNRFESRYYVISSEDNLLKSEVNVSIENATEVWIEPGKINNVSTYIVAVYDPAHLLGYTYSCKPGQVVLGNKLTFKNNVSVSTIGKNFTLKILRHADLQVFPNYWAAMNYSVFSDKKPNFLIVDRNIEVSGYVTRGMTSLNSFYEKTAKDITFDLMLIDLITIVVIYLFINALLSFEIKENVKKIAIMQAIGSTRWNIGAIYILRALYIGTAGMITGFSLGVILAYLLAALIPLSGMLTYFVISIPHMVFLVDILLSVVGSIFASLIPVKNAIRINIVEGMKGALR